MNNYKDFVDTVAQTTLEDKDNAISFVSSLSSFNYKKTKVALKQQEEEFDKVLENVHLSVIKTVDNYTTSMNNLMTIINKLYKVRSKKVAEIKEASSDMVVVAHSKYKEIEKIWDGMFVIKEGKKDE